MSDQSNEGTGAIERAIQMCELAVANMREKLDVGNIPNNGILREAIANVETAREYLCQANDGYHRYLAREAEGLGPADPPRPEKQNEWA